MTVNVCKRTSAKNRHVVLFSRRQEDITSQYPDVAQARAQRFAEKRRFVEGELVAVDRKTGKLKDFQTLMQRRRKHDVER